ncbi:hypothetical protein Vafri_11315, partial [Volvox africanus]
AWCFSYLEAHHELAGRALAAMEQTRPLHADVDVVQVEVFPLGLAFLKQLRQLEHVGPRARTALLHLDLLKLVGLPVQSAGAGSLGEVLEAAVLADVPAGLCRRSWSCCRTYLDIQGEAYA